MKFKIKQQSSGLIAILLILHCKLISSYSESVEEEEEQFASVEDDDNNFLNSLENSVPASSTARVPQQPKSHILINVKHIVEFINGMKKSQNEMFRKIEKLAKSVEFTDKHKQTAVQLKLSALENRVLQLERSRSRTTIQYSTSTTSRPPTPTYYTHTLLPAPSSRQTQTRSLNDISPGAAGFEINQPFTPRPLYTVPTFPSRSSRSRNTGGSSSRLYSQSVPDNIEVRGQVHSSQGHGQGRLGHVQMTPVTFTAMTTTPEDVPEASASEEDNYSTHSSSRGFTTTETSHNNLEARIVMRKVMELERSVSELQRNVSRNNNPYMAPISNPGSGQELSLLKDKQGQLQRAVDTVMVQFSGIYRNLEEVEEKIESCCTSSGKIGVGNSNLGFELTTAASTTSTTPTSTTKTTPTSTLKPTLTHPLTTRPPYSFPWGSSGGISASGSGRSTTYRPPYHSFGFDNDLGHAYAGDILTTNSTTTGAYSTAPPSNFGDYGRTPERWNEDEDNDWDDPYSQRSGGSRDNDNSYSEPAVSAEREAEPDPEPMDFANFAFLKAPAKRSRRNKLGLKSLRTSSTVQSDEGQDKGRVARDLSVLARTMKNLTKQVGQQRQQIHALSSELAKVNVSHMLLLRTMDQDTIKRSIRPRDCFEIQLLHQLDNNPRTHNNTKNVTNANYQNQDSKQSQSSTQKRNGKGKFTIFPKNNDDPIQVICDLNGGWTIIQRRGVPMLNESRRTNFFRNWTQYEQGFGHVDEDYWIGLSNIAALTQFDDQELRIELTKWDGKGGVASYSHFKVDPASSLYRLHVSGYSGNVGDSLSRHTEMAFSTFDSDNDADLGRNCALEWKGAWWYYGCHESNLNGLYARDQGRNGTFDFGTGIVWQSWTGNYYSLQQVEIKIRNRVNSRWNKT